jgi:hypothetical protein
LIFFQAHAFIAKTHEMEKKNKNMRVLGDITNLSTNKTKAAISSCMNEANDLKCVEEKIVEGYSFLSFKKMVNLSISNICFKYF